nr:MAG TPA_asm: hypothetical protein [Caudoviricetes sp.]
MFFSNTLLHSRCSFIEYLFYPSYIYADFAKITTTFLKNF